MVMIIMVEQLCLFQMNAEQLIRFKELRLQKINSSYLNLIDKERELKNVENSLWLNTDFKSLKLTNDTMRRAFVSDNTSDLRFEVDHLKYELKQHETDLIIINDLLALRMKEVIA